MFVQYIIKHQFHEYLCPITFEQKIDVTIFIKLHRATRIQLLALYKSLTMIVTSFYVQNVIEHRFSWNKGLNNSSVDKKETYLRTFSCQNSPFRYI